MIKFCNKILICLIFFLTENVVLAADIVYPRYQKSTINADSTFFAGNTNPKKPLYINEQLIFVHKNGAFAQKVPLNIGENIFKIRSGMKTQTYIITRKATLNLSINNYDLKKYNNEKFVMVKKEGAALRKTPIEEGINRIAHLEKGVLLKVDGEKNNLYRVVLAKNEYAWINKKHVADYKCKIPYVNILNRDFQQTDNAYIYRLKLSSKVPYTLEESTPMKLNIYTLDGDKISYDIKLKHKIFGCDAYYEGNDLVIRINKKPAIISKFKPLKGIKLVIDAGHGGKELGAISCLRNNEKDLNLKIALLLEEELTKKGAEVYMTRKNDKYMSLDDRIKFSHKKDPLIFISIHANSLPDVKDPQKHRGSSVYYYYDCAKPLAESILNSMVENLNVNNDGLHQRSFAVIRNERALSILVETAYVINPYDNELLVDEKFQKNCAKAISKGVINFLKSE